MAAARLGTSMPDAVEWVLDMVEQYQKKEYAEEYDYIGERNKADLEELLEDAESVESVESPEPEEPVSQWVCQKCGRDYRVDKEEPYCEHVKFTGNAYYLGHKLIRAASQAETLAYNKKRRKELYGK